MTRGAIPDWARGFIRIFVVLCGATWIGLSLLFFKNTTDDLWLVYRQVNPYLGYPGYPSEDDWCVIIATKAFLSKPEADRIIVAERFFEKEIEPLADALLLDNKEFKKWFVKTALLSLQEAPIKEFRPTSALESPLWYRAIPTDGMPRVRFTRILFDPQVFGVSFLVSIGVMVPVVGVFLVVRWIVRGFKVKPGVPTEK